MTRLLATTLAALLAAVCWTQAAAAEEAGTLVVAPQKHAVSNAARLFGAEMIVGGKETRITKYPYLVSVEKYFKDEEKWFHNCAGTILNPNSILTSAYCIQEEPKASYRIRAGSTERGKGGKIIAVDKKVYHSKFNSKTLDYDVAVLRLAKQLILSSSIQRVTLPPPLQSQLKAGTKLNVAGWGMRHAIDIELPKTLRQIDVAIVSAKECAKDYKGYRAVTSRMVCAAAPGKDACEGDSGSPLMSKRSHVQYGIVSWGRGCAEKGSPGVYTSLANKEIRAFIKKAQK